MSIESQKTTEVEGHAGYSTGPPVDILSIAEAEAIGLGIAQGVQSVYELVELAKAGRAWEPLGLPDMYSFLLRFLDAEHLRIPPAERESLFCSLTDGGMSYRQIEEATGTGIATISRTLNPPVKAPRNAVPNGTPSDHSPKRYTKAQREADRAELAEMAEQIRAAQPKARTEATLLACISYIEEFGWHQFNQAVIHPLAVEYADKITVT